MATTRRSYTGKVIGHTVKFMNRKIEDKGSGVTLTKSEKLCAMVSIQVEDKKTYTVTSKKMEVILTDGSPDDVTRARTYNDLTKHHPFGAERVFHEFIKKNKNKPTITRYRLEEG